MTRPTILLVDDVRENLLAMAAALRRDDAEVLLASSGQEALELLLVREVAVALLDVQMPGMDGFELAELMRGVGRTRAIPILFVTAGPSDHRGVFRGYESGAVDFLLKPIDPYVLTSKVGIFLELHRQRQQLAEQLEELRRVEARLRDADRRKDEFLALLSHELRNPLMPIRNALYLMTRSEAGSTVACRSQAIIQRQVSHMVRLVDDLLDLTRITRGKVQLRRERLDAVEALREVVEDHRELFVRNGISLEVSAPDGPIWLNADRTRLAQIAGNLLGNAAKYTPHGGHVSVSLTAVGERATLTVQDDGVGIAPEMLATMFEPFSQADRSLARSQGGLGLGLALVKGMVELHGGEVSARSDGPGRGSTFRVVLPTAEKGAPAEPPREPEPARASRRRVLLIEDGRDSGDTLAEALRLMGHEVAIARDGRAGVELARSFRPEVVLCDLGLPGMSGFEVAEELRGDQDLRDTTLVAVSGYASPEDQRRATSAGFAGLIPKPPRLEALDALLSGRGEAAAEAAAP